MSIVTRITRAPTIITTLFIIIMSIVNRITRAPTTIITLFTIIMSMVTTMTIAAVIRITVIMNMPTGAMDKLTIIMIITIAYCSRHDQYHQNHDHTLWFY